MGLLNDDYCNFADIVLDVWFDFEKLNHPSKDLESFEKSLDKGFLISTLSSENKGLRIVYAHFGIKFSLSVFKIDNFHSGKSWEILEILRSGGFIL